MTQRSIQLITGFLLVLVTGVFWGTWFSLSRSIHSFPPEMFIAIGKEIISNVAAPMRLIMPASLLGLLLLLLSSWKTKTIYFYCIGTALLLFIIVLAITVGIEVPIDNQIKTWSADTIPAGWESIRDRWAWYHTLRTFVALAGISFFMASLISKDQAPAKG